MTTRRPLVAGNWKMNGLKASVPEFRRIVEGYDAALRARTDLMVCPPATLLAGFAAAEPGSPVGLAGQDCHPAASGAHTGDISAEMLADAGAGAVIVGHSERRADHGESDELVRAKAEAARRAGLLAIICVGETREVREAGRALDVVRGQLAGSVPDGADGENTVIAYEPVWAIGTGLTPTIDEIAEMHGAMRAHLKERFGGQADRIRLLYGGSVKPENAGEILAAADVDGALVGGASLEATSFLSIARAYL
ncbi:triose-phosphate isomerase [Ancylobacter sp. MQZ15Z-1]|uniref:Triosephosphate isomerase n=1 Tax=Ancylobacter mangrovi TaxID=2972472 RepID=A0A9X2PNS2_9HYPH|nr:triose-phosphate isomerase [Ancylobacter mangrovi]MCS0497098.1 triose-phosphate isomerase [Ancylobacter mangrovi]